MPGVRFSPSRRSRAVRIERTRPPYCKQGSQMSEPRRRRGASARPARPALLLAALIALAVAGCGASTTDYGGAHPDYAKALAGSPPPLAALHRQANELLPGGKDAYEERIAALRGYPAVV